MQSRRDSEKWYPGSQGLDYDPGDEMAIAVALYLSRRGDFDHSKDRAIVAK